MPRTIEEIRSGINRKFRVRELDSNGSQICCYEVWCTLKTLKENGFTYVFLFDKNGNLNETVYRYLNFWMQSGSANYRVQIGSTLKQLYEFSACIQKDVKEFTYQDFVYYQQFLRGYSNRNNANGIYIYEVKSNSSIKMNLLHVRHFLACQHYPNAEYVGRLYDEQNGTNGSVNLDCPMFISYAEMMDIHNYLEHDHSISALTRAEYRALYDLEYFSGLRNGEALGLTLQDVIMTYSSDGEPVYKAIIRNRVSDSPRQCAKRLMKVTSTKAYRSREYRSKKHSGYQEVLLREDVYREIMDYFDLCMGKFHRIGLKPAPADNVKDDGEENYYIFNNARKNTPLDYKTLREYTRKMFKALGIPVDTGSREHNLLHRFRHGFCMYLLFVKKMPAEQVIIFSRHASINSLLPYMNPTGEMLEELYKTVWKEDNYED